MASLIGTHSGWQQVAATTPAFTADTGAALDPALVMAFFYDKSEAADATNFQATWGGEATTTRLYEQVSGQYSILVFVWNSTAAAARVGNSVAMTGANSAGMYTWFMLEDTASGTPFQEINIQLDAAISTAPTIGPLSLNGASDYQAVLWTHWGTANRTFTVDAGWNTIETGSFSSGRSNEYGISDAAAGGKTAYSLGVNTNDSFPMCVIGFTFDSPAAAGFSFTNLDGGTTAYSDRFLGTDMSGQEVDNRAVALVTNGGDVTAVEIAGTNQPDFEYSAATGDAPEQILFSVSVGDLAFGSYTGANGLSFINADNPGDDDNDITLLPAENTEDYLTVSGYTEGAITGSILDLFNDASYCTDQGINQGVVADGDQYWFETVTNLGFTVSTTATGVPTIGGGDVVGHYYRHQVRRASDSNQWSGWAYVYVNYQAVIIEVDGVTGDSGKFDVNSTDIVFKGSNFGVELGDAELWAMPGENANLDTAIAVQQNPLGTEITSFGNNEFTLSSFDSGGGLIDNGTYVTFWFIPGASP